MMDAKSGKNSQKCRIRKGQAGKGLPGPARRSNPRILACEPKDGIFTGIDPLAEKYYHLSPYAYCAGNPVNVV